MRGVGQRPGVRVCAATASAETVRNADTARMAEMVRGSSEARRAARMAAF